MDRLIGLRAAPLCSAWNRQLISDGVFYGRSEEGVAENIITKTETPVVGDG